MNPTRCQIIGCSIQLHFPHYGVVTIGHSTEAPGSIAVCQPHYREIMRAQRRRNQTQPLLDNAPDTA